MAAGKVRPIVFGGLLGTFGLFHAVAADGTATAPISACALLNASEVAAVLGAKVDVGEPHDSGVVESGRYVAAGTYSSTCLWRVASEEPAAPSDPTFSLGGVSYAILSAMQWPAGSGQAKNFLQSFRDAAQEGVIEKSPVALNIADGALWWGDGVAVYKGDRSLGISVHLIGGRDKERAMEEALAKLAAARL